MEIKTSVLSFPPTKNQQFSRAIGAYRNGDYKSALTDSVSLVDQGFENANMLAGLIHERGGHGVQQDLGKAFFYYQKAVAVGVVEGWLALGRFYYLGIGIPVDYEAAHHCYSVVQEDADHPVAYLMLGRMYHEGQGVSKDLVKAEAYYQDAAKKGAVFGVSYLGSLELERGNFLNGIWLRTKATLMALLIWLRDRNDPRFRQM